MSATAKSQVQPSQVPQPWLNSGLWILLPPTKLQQSWGQRRINLTLGDDTSFSGMYSMQPASPPPFWHTGVQTSSASGGWGSLGKAVGLNLWHLPKSWPPLVLSLLPCMDTLKVVIFPEVKDVMVFSCRCLLNQALKVQFWKMFFFLIS